MEAVERAYSGSTSTTYIPEAAPHAVRQRAGMEGTRLDRHTLDCTNVLLPRSLHAMPVLPTVDRVAEHLKCGIVLEQVDGVVDGLGAVR